MSLGLQQMIHVHVYHHVECKHHSCDPYRRRELVHVDFEKWSPVSLFGSICSGSRSSGAHIRQASAIETVAHCCFFHHRTSTSIHHEEEYQLDHQTLQSSSSIMLSLRNLLVSITLLAAVQTVARHPSPSIEERDTRITINMDGWAHSFETASRY